MATSKSSKKRIRQNKVSRMRNRKVKTALRGGVKQMKALIAAGDVEAATALQPTVQKQLDRSASKGVIHRGAARRTKSRLAAGLNAARVKAAAQAETTD